MNERIRESLTSGCDSLNVRDYFAASRIASLVLNLLAKDNDLRSPEYYSVESEAYSLLAQAHLGLGDYMRASIHYAQAGQAGQCAHSYILAARTAAHSLDPRITKKTILNWYSEAIEILSRDMEHQRLQETRKERYEAEHF